MYCRACSNEKFIRQHMKNKTILFRKWLSTGRLDTYQAKAWRGGRETKEREGKEGGKAGRVRYGG